MLRARVLIALAMVIGGCRDSLGSPDAEVPDAGPLLARCFDWDGGFGDAGAVFVEDFCANLARATCMRHTACGITETVEGCLDSGVVDLTICRPSTAAPLSYAPSGLVERVRGGTVGFDCGAAARCLAELPTSCAPPTSCSQVYRGLVPLDGQCTLNLDCVPGAFCGFGDRCAPRSNEGQSYSGYNIVKAGACREGLVPIMTAYLHGPTMTCSSRRGLGDSCAIEIGSSPLNVCQASLVCSISTMRCETQAQLGEPCPADDTGQKALSPCANQLSCQSSDGGPNVCQPLRALGESCGICKLDLFCNAGRCESR